jgi:hypothetical protein
MIPTEIVQEKYISNSCRNTSNDDSTPGFSILTCQRTRDCNEFLLQVKVFPLIGQSNTYISMACQSAIKIT